MADGMFDALEFRVGLDTSEVERGLARSEKAAESAGRKMGKALSPAGQSLGQIVDQSNRISKFSLPTFGRVADAIQTIGKVGVISGAGMGQASAGLKAYSNGLSSFSGFVTRVSDALSKSQSVGANMQAVMDGLSSATSLASRVTGGFATVLHHMSGITSGAGGAFAALGGIMDVFRGRSEQAKTIVTANSAAMVHATAAAEGLGDGIARAGQESRGAAGNFGAVERRVTSLQVGMVAAAAAAYGMAKAASGIARGAIQTGQEFESLEARLGTLMGGMGAAQKRTAELFDFAASTPFELAGIAEAEVNLRALGVNAEEVLPLVMDFAGAMGTDLASAAVEVGRAMQFGAGAVETISGRALRAQIELRTGQDALKMSTAEFREEMIKTLTDPDGIFAGGTNKLAKTFAGLVSNMEDEWTKFSKTVADAKFFDGVKAATKEVLDLLEENRAAVDDFATAVGEGLYGSMLLAISAGGGFVDLFDMILIGVKAVEVATRTWMTWWLGSLADAIDAFETLNAAMGDPLKQGDKLSAAWQRVAGFANDAGKELNAAKSDLGGMVDEFGRGTDAANRMIDAIERSGSQGRQLRDFAERAAGAAGATTTSGTGDAGAGAEAETDALTALANEYASMTAERLSAAEKIDLWQRTELMRLEQFKQEYAHRADIVAAATAVQIQVEQAAADQMEGLRAKQLADAEAAAQARADAERQAAQDALQAWTSTASQIGGYVQQGLSMLSSSMSDAASESADHVARLETQLAASEAFYTEAQQREAERRVDIMKDAAQRQFRAAKQAKIAEAIASTALAAINAIAQSPPPSPFGLIGAGIATAAGMASVAQIQGQQLVMHRGGFVDLAPDEVRMTARKNEAMLSPTGRQAIGDDAIRDANAGIKQQGREIVAVTVYDHSLVTRRWKADGLRANDPIQQAIDSGSLVGLR